MDHLYQSFIKHMGPIVAKTISIRKIIVIQQIQDMITSPGSMYTYTPLCTGTHTSVYTHTNIYI